MDPGFQSPLSRALPTWALLRRAFGAGLCVLLLRAPDYPGSKKYAALGGTPALPANLKIGISVSWGLDVEYVAWAGDTCAKS